MHFTSTLHGIPLLFSLQSLDHEQAHLSCYKYYLVEKVTTVNYTWYVHAHVVIRDHDSKGLPGCNSCLVRLNFTLHFKTFR